MFLFCVVKLYSMVKVISFSLYGIQSIYLVGIIRNVEIAKIMYPDFECWVYVHSETVPINVTEELKTYSHVKIIQKTGNLHICKPKMWRFEPICDDNVEITLSRDVDTQILKREVLAVNEWINSNSTFHIMRDHPGHSFLIMAGMFGIKKTNVNWKAYMDQFVQTDDYFYDQIFLKHIYAMYLNDTMVHASFNKYEPYCRNFPISHEEDDYRFVGEYVHADESRNENDVLKIKQYYM